MIKLNDYTWAAVVAVSVLIFHTRNGPDDLVMTTALLSFASLAQVITATVSFPGMIGDFMSLSDARLVDDLFSHHELDDSAYHRNSRDWSGPLPFCLFTAFP